jgi:hypothetical protein
LLLEMIERLISKERTVSNVDGQKERRIVVDEFFVLISGRIEYYVFGVTVVLYPPLADVVDRPPSTTTQNPL